MENNQWLLPVILPTGGLWLPVFIQSFLIGENLSTIAFLYAIPIFTRNDKNSENTFRLKDNSKIL